MPIPERTLAALAVVAALCVLADRAVGAEAATRTSFVIFLTDDQGWGDAGYNGHPEIKTPNLDRFASQGLRLNQCYAACSVCSPSRSSILTGRTPYRNGVWRWIPSGSQYHLRSSEITLATLLRKKGYATCHVGKWHLNGHFNRSTQPQPSDHGYDWWFATQNNAAPSHANPTNFVRNGEPVGRLEGYSAVLVAGEAIRWLKERRDRSKPFFLTVWTHEPHLPIESAPRFMKPYEHIDDPGIRQHHGNITQLDHAFGMVLDALDELELADSTLVIFTSDNGPEGSGEVRDRKNPDSMRNRTRGSTGGLRGRKRHTHEGGIRVPGLIRWPGRIAPGSVSDTPVIGSDIFPTVLAIADVEQPSDRIIDGASLLPLFEGRPVQRTQPLYWRNHLAPRQYRVALREGDWKIIGSDDLSTFELYNLREDPRESEDLSKRHPAVFARLKKRLIEHDKSVLADGPDWWKDEKPRRQRKKKKSA